MGREMTSNHAGGPRLTDLLNSLPGRPLKEEKKVKSSEVKTWLLYKNQGTPSLKHLKIPSILLADNVKHT